MSDIFSLSPEQVNAAVPWNRANAAAHVQGIPEAAYVVYPELRRLEEALREHSLLDAIPDALDLLAFTLETGDIQDAAAGGAGAKDGLFGAKTARWLQQHFSAPPAEAPPEGGWNGWIATKAPGRRVIPELRAPGYRKVTFEDDPFWRLSRSSNYGEPVKFVCGHWGGRSPRSLQDYFSSTDRDVSSHGSVGYDNDGQLLMAQTIDLSRSSWHGGWINRYSVGFDIAFSPEVDRASYGQARGWPINIIDNPTSRGDKRIIDLPDDLAEATAWLMVEWALVCGVPLRWVSRDPSVLLSKQEILDSEGGFIFHSQWDGGKWDFAPWAKKVMRAVDLIIGNPAH